MMSDATQPTPTRDFTRWWPTLFLVASLLPQLLTQLGFGFPARLAMYTLWPLGMGPFALLQGSLVAPQVGLHPVLGWVAAAALGLLWIVLLISVERWRGELVFLVYALGAIFPAWLLGRFILPPF